MKQLRAIVRIVLLPWRLLERIVFELDALGYVAHAWGYRIGERLGWLLAGYRGPQQ